MTEYITSIGLEVHVELNTRTKIFCNCYNRFGDKVNTNICPVCIGMPGTLPTLNKKVVELAIKAGLALNCNITSKCEFDRKNYFYPDNPQNYQISQLYSPICKDGYIRIDILQDTLIDNKVDKQEKYESASTKKIRINEIHMEEDAGKLLHCEDGKNTLIDYNRAGVPLIEIVTMPDMNSVSEVIAFLEKLRDRIQYIGASDCKLNEGSMRVDVNLSVRKKLANELGCRTEMKNLNSFKAIAHAIKHERNRQIELLERGATVTMETRRWDDNSNCSYIMRSKEDARDYRYFNEPDLSVLNISSTWIEDLNNAMPEFREDRQARFINQYKISEYDARLLTEKVDIADFFERTVSICKEPKKVSNWLMGENARLLNANTMEFTDVCYTEASLAKLIELCNGNKITRTTAKQIFEKMFYNNIEPEKYARENELFIDEVDSSEDILNEVIDRIITENEQSVKDYMAGKKKAIGYLVGQTMKSMSKRANASKIKELLEKKGL